MLFQNHLVSSFRQFVTIILTGKLVCLAAFFKPHLSSLLSLSNPSCHFTSSCFSCWELITTTWPSSTALWSLSMVCLGCSSSVREAPSGWELQEHHTFNSTPMHVKDRQWLHICNSIRGFFLSFFLSVFFSRFQNAMHTHCLVHALQTCLRKSSVAFFSLLPMITLQFLW